jgi:hypothetical protein
MRRRRRGLAVALAVTCAAVSMGCGIGADDQPRALPVSTSTTTTTPAATDSANDRAAAVLWFVSGSDLIPVSAGLPDRELSTVFTELLAPSDATLGDLASSIPSGTQLRKLSLDRGVLVISLSSEFQNLAGPARQQAIAQMVLSATEASGVESVEFSVEGQPIRVSSPERGDVTTVTDCDFASLLPTAEEAAANQLSPATVQQLDLRRGQLAQRCAGR